MMRILTALRSLPETSLFINLVTALLAGAALVLLFITIAHTLFVLGRQTPLYTKRKPVPGWNKRFYPAVISLILFLLALMWALNAWHHSGPNS